MPERILLHFACNDPNNGNFSGRCGRVELSITSVGTLAELDCGWWPPSRFPKFAALPEDQRITTHVRIGRKKYPVRSYTTWVGNWCWDAASVSSATAAEVLNDLRKQGWHNEGGLSDIGYQWDRGEKFRPSDIAHLALAEDELAARKRSRATGTPLPPEAP